jgi:hypothetical protein
MYTSHMSVIVISTVNAELYLHLLFKPQDLIFFISGVLILEWWKKTEIWLHELATNDDW